MYRLYCYNLDTKLFSTEFSLNVYIHKNIDSVFVPDRLSAKCPVRILTFSGVIYIIICTQFNAEVKYHINKIYHKNTFISQDTIMILQNLYDRIIKDLRSLRLNKILNV